VVCGILGTEFVCLFVCLFVELEEVFYEEQEQSFGVEIVKGFG
jgi:hypothetical protein